MKTIAALLLSASAHNLTMEEQMLTAEDYHFMRFVSEHTKSYGTRAEYNFRAGIFKSNLAEIENLNASQDTAEYRVNEFSDMTKAEMSKKLGYKHQERDTTHEKTLDTTDLADTVDWRTKGAVTPVKNQGQCGSCWSFSTTGAVEGAMFLKTGKLESYSEQQLVDCDHVDQGCNGGLMDNAFKYIESNPLMTEAEYAYTARKSFMCKYKKSEGTGTVKSFADVPQGSIDQLKAAIAKAPVSIAVEADQQAFQGYHSGVVTTGCGTQLDHGVLAVGYGTLNGTPYFLVKNSWGPTWGDQGYLRIGAQPGTNVCGILNSASYPLE